MNCKDVNETLDRMIFEEIPGDAGLLQHLAMCPSCTRAYAEAIEARGVMNMVRRSEPLLGDSDGLTHDILDALPGRPAKTKAFSLVLARLLAAASVALVLVFGYEQYGIVKKIYALEKQCIGVENDSRYPDLRQLASSRNISQAGISLTGIERLISPGRPEAGMKGKVK
jgi:hypothetical protein